MTNLIGTTLATIGASSVATFLAVHMAENSLHADEQVIATIEIIASLIILFFGEIGPKILGITIPEKIALFVAPIYLWIFLLFRPISWLVEVILKFLSFVLGKDLEIHTKEITEEELDAFIDMSHAGGAVEDDEKRQIKNILGLS